MAGLIGRSMAKPEGLDDEDEDAAGAPPQGGAAAKPGGDAGDGYSDSEDRTLAAGEADPDPGAARGDAAGGSQADPAGAEDDDPEYDDALERVLTAAVQGLKQPQMVEDLRALRAQPDPQAIADLAMNIVDGLDEKSGATIPEDVLPGAALGVAAMIGDVIGAPQPVIAQAGQIMLLRALENEGADPQELQQVLSQVDINAMVEKATAQMGGEAGQPQTEPQEA